MPLDSNTRLDHYEIIAPLGAGGMGEVYRARDTRLDREVAIKVLPADFAQDADGQMMAVALKPSRATFEFETPKALFKTRMLTGQIQSGIEYDVTADGQRFLIGTMVGEANATPVSVILNWMELLKK